MNDKGTIEEKIKRLSVQNIDLSGTLVCDPYNCKHKYGRWKDAEAIFKETHFKAKARFCSKCEGMS